MKRYRTSDIAREVKQSRRTVQRYLRERVPQHEGWWTFDDEEFQAVVRELDTIIKGHRRFGAGRGGARRGSGRRKR
jgi:hypothetical protein